MTSGPINMCTVGARVSVSSVLKRTKERPIDNRLRTRPAAATGNQAISAITLFGICSRMCTRISHIDGLFPSRHTFWAHRRHRGTRVAAPGVERAE